MTESRTKSIFPAIILFGTFRINLSKYARKFIFLSVLIFNIPSMRKQQIHQHGHTQYCQCNNVHSTNVIIEKIISQKYS